MDYPSETSQCTDAPAPQTPLSLIFSERRGRLHTGYLERIISSSNCPSKLTDKFRRIVHSKFKLFHFQIKKYYLSDANHQTDNSSHTNNPSSENGHFCYNECRAPALSWAFACLLLLFHKDHF